MRFVTFEHGHGPRLGILERDQVVDATAEWPELGHDMGALLARRGADPGAIASRVDQSRHRHSSKDVRLLAPVLTPRKFYGVGMNYGSFMTVARRLQLPLPPSQVWFSRPLSGVSGPDAPIVAPSNTASLDFEGELAIVIGKRCRAMTRERAPEVIAGYTICNDVTVRDWAARSPLLGKSFDTHAPIGPCIVTPDELGDPHVLELRTWVNDELLQSGNTSDMLQDCYALVAALSAVTTLEAGDILLTGTPDGCGILHEPPRFLRPGDQVRIEIDGIGSLRNPVIAETES